MAIADLSMTANVAPLQLCGVELGPKSHVCAFFRNRQEEYDALIPFMADGLTAGERAFFTGDPELQEELRERLQAVEVDVGEMGRDGHLCLRTWNETHLRDSRFDPEATLAYFGAASQEGKRQGFKRTRFVTQMGWACEALPGTERLFAYEAQASALWTAANEPLDPVICSYDLSRFRADVIVGAMQTHPVLLVGGILQENPFFVPPDQYLRDLRARRGP